MSTQEPPFAIQIEPTEGCTLACSFCALQSIRDNGADAELGIHGKNSPPYRFMEIQTAERIAHELRRLRWNARIELAMHGEPTVNPRLSSIIHVLRKARPDASIMVTSNGSGVTSPERVESLFHAGMNTLAIDNYKHADFVAMMRRKGVFKSLPNEVETFRYPRDKEGNPHARYSGMRVVVIDDITQNKNGTHKLTNQGGNSFKAGKTLKQRCAKPFRELSIRWDGNVALCCDDWRGEYKIGNVLELPLDEIWNHERFRAARMALYHGRRDMINVCSGCNVRTYRNGLLPDKLGKEELRKPSTETEALIREAQRGKVFSIKLVK